MIRLMTRKEQHPAHDLQHEPVLAVCGWSGAGKTTVLEAVIAKLAGRGLRVAVVKHDAHGVQVDRRGKDSDRLFRAGASVHLRSPDELVSRVRTAVGEGLESAVWNLLRRHDLVLVEGHKGTPLPKVWCTDESGAPPPPAVESVLSVLARDDRRPDLLGRIIDARLDEAHRRRPVFGGLLIGGSGRRMGSPKQLLSFRGRSVLRRCLDGLGPAVDRAVILGRGALPEDVGPLPQLPDAPDCGDGPAAAFLTAFRWAPRCCWVLAACDMPRLSRDAMDWLLAARRPGRWAVVPRCDSGHLEPLLALYEPPVAALLAEQLRGGRRALHHLAQHPTVHTPRIPDRLASAWTNVNTPEQLALLEAGESGNGRQGETA